MERERSILANKLEELLGGGVLANTVRRCQELHWQLDEALERGGRVNEERQAYIAGLESALQRSGLQIQELNAQVANWKGAEAAAVLMLKDSCAAFRSYSDKLVKDKDEAVAGALARVHELESQQRELAQQLQAHAQSSRAAASSLQVAQDELAASGSLKEGLARDLSRQCAALQARREEAEEEAREWRARAGEAEVRATRMSAVHAEKMDALQRQVLEEQGRCGGCGSWGGGGGLWCLRERESFIWNYTVTVVVLGGMALGWGCDDV